MGSPCLDVHQVWKVFGPKPERALDLAEEGRPRGEILEETGCTVAVRDVSFDVQRGETFVVMGLSGSGKSTLVRCIAQLTRVSKGQVSLDGEELTSMSEDALRRVRREKLSMVFQHFGLLPHRRVIDNVAYGLEVQGMPRAERHARALEVLDVVGLHGWGDHYPQQLSGGMQQRVGLARALAVDPEVLFFDEPFSALDPLIRREMQDELLRLQHEMNRTIVFITHDFAEAIKLGDRIAIMKDGKLDQIGNAAELITDPATDYVKEFTKDIPKAKVLTAGDVMHAADGELPRGAVNANATVESLLPDLLTDPRPLEVVDVVEVGIVDRAAVARVLDQ
jgi:glycine betaine/proline transport system ATP-binding protein